MNKLIEIKLQVTALQLASIAELLNGETPEPLVEGPGASTTGIDDQEKPDPNVVTDPKEIAEAFEKDQAAEDNNVASEAFGAATTDTPPPPPADNGVELAKGMNGQMIPWDARIHGAAKKKNADGSWRLKQGIGRDVLVPQVEAELLAAQQAGKSASSAAVTDTPAPPATDTATQTAAPTAEVPPPPAAEGKPTTFAELLPLVTAAKANGTLTDEKIAEASSALGLAQFGLIATRPDLIPQMVEKLGV